MSSYAKCVKTAWRLLLFFTLVGPLPLSAVQAQDDGADQRSAEEIAADLANPNTPLASLNFKLQFRTFEGNRSLVGAPHKRHAGASETEGIGTLLELSSEPFPVSKAGVERSERFEDVSERAWDVDGRGLVPVARRDRDFFDAKVEKHGADEHLRVENEMIREVVIAATVLNCPSHVVRYDKQCVRL